MSYKIATVVSSDVPESDVIAHVEGQPEFVHYGFSRPAIKEEAGMKTYTFTVEV